jgi:mannosyltransferase
MFGRRYHYLLTALALVLTAFFLRAYRLDAAGFWQDEAFSAQAVAQGFAGIIDLVTTSEPHPPLYYEMLRAWYLLAGPTEYALRWPSLMAGVVTVALIYRVGTLLSRRTIGLIAAGLVAFSPYQVWHSQEARMYALLACFGLAALYGGLVAVRQGSWPSLAAYSVCMLLALYTHYYAIFLFVVLSGAMLAAIYLSPGARLTFRGWLAASAAVSALYLPWLVIASRISMDHVPNRTNDYSVIILEAIAAYSAGLAVPYNAGLAIGAGFIVVAAAGLMYSTRASSSLWGRFPLGLLACYLLVPAAIGAVISLSRPMFVPRYFMVSAPALFLLLGLGVFVLFRRARPLGIVAGGFLLVAQSYGLYQHYFDYRFVKSDYPDAVRYVEGHLRPGDAVILAGWGQRPQFWYYHSFIHRDPVPAYLFPLGGATGWQETPGKLDEAMAGHRGAWFLDHDVTGWDGEHRIEAHLSRNYYPSIFQPVGHNRVLYFASPPPARKRELPVNLACDGKVRLKRMRLPAGPIRAGDIVPLDLDWQAIDAPGTDYKVSWRLLDPGGRIVLQRDARPAAGFAPTTEWTAGAEMTDRYGMPLTPGLLPGTYTIAVALYDARSGTSCSLGPEPQARLAEIEVTEAIEYPTFDVPKPIRTFGDLSLLSAKAPAIIYRPGDKISFSLIWRAEGDQPPGYSMVAQTRKVSGPGPLERSSELQIAVSLARFGRQPLPADAPDLGPPWFPSGRWSGGKLYQTYLDVPIPANATTGDYAIWLAAGDASGVGAGSLEAGRVFVLSRLRSYQASPPGHPVSANFGGLVQTLGFDLEPAPGSTIAAGQEITLRLQLRAASGMDRSYKVFVQLLGPDGRLYGQRDATPLDGRAPTNGWIEGEVLVDTYRLAVQPGAPPGEYRLIAGLYDAASGQRLLLEDGANSLDLALLVVP